MTTNELDTPSVQSTDKYGNLVPAPDASTLSISLDLSKIESLHPSKTELALSDIQLRLSAMEHKLERVLDYLHDLTHP